MNEASISKETFDDFLASQGLLQACEERAIKEMIVEQLEEAMLQQKLSKSAMAARMATSRRQLDRLLDPSSGSMTLESLRRACAGRWQEPED